jgi:hypothetical protein
MARVFGKGSTYRVSLDPAAVDRFRARWPASNLGDLKRVSFEFDRRSGDLVDAYCNGRKGNSCEPFDGAAMVALSQDAQCIGERRARPKPEHAPRCSGTDWKNLLGGRRGPLTGAGREIKLWKRERSGLWSPQRTVQPAEAARWLDIFRKQEPGVVFTVSPTEPPQPKSVHSSDYARWQEKIQALARKHTGGLGAAKGAAAAPERCRTSLSTCMKSAAKVGAVRKGAAAAICMREFNQCRRA